MLSRVFRIIFNGFDAVGKAWWFWVGGVVKNADSARTLEDTKKGGDLFVSIQYSSVNKSVLLFLQVIWAHRHLHPLNQLCNINWNRWPTRPWRLLEACVDTVELPLPFDHHPAAKPKYAETIGKQRISTNIKSHFSDRHHRNWQFTGHLVHSD